MKRIIEIPDKVVEAIQNGEDYRYDIHTAIAQSKPYDDSGDLISREALIREIGRTDEWYKGRSICDIIDNAPTVAVNCKNCDGYEAGYSAGLKDAERPKGEWKMITNAFQETKYQCNQCKHYTRVGDDRNFCPNCGAKMKGGAE